DWGFAGMAARLGQAGTLRRAHGYSKATGRRVRRRGGIRLHDGSPRAAIGEETADRAEEVGAPRVAQTFQSAGSPDFPVRCSDGRLESRPNPQSGMSALHGSHAWTLYPAPPAAGSATALSP